MNVGKIIETLVMIGADLPAYRALFDQVTNLFDEKDQAELKAAYAEAMRLSDEAHKAAQQVHNFSS